MMRLSALALLALLAASAPALAEPLTVHTGETWLFTLDHGEPVHARKADSRASPDRGEVKVTVRALFGTMMTISSNNSEGYTFEAQLVDADGNAVTTRTCTLPPGNQPALESWQKKASAVRISDFKPATGGRC